MKEIRYFYDPALLLVEPKLESSINMNGAGASRDLLPDSENERVVATLQEEEATHALRVLRLGVGDDINVIDGRGHLIEGTIVEAAKRTCRYIINKVESVPPLWPHKVRIAVAPTKNIDRMEWFVEKATEIGVDSITFLDCQFSERRVVKTERLDKIAIAAMKQSHKFYKPQINDIVSFKDYIAASDGQRFIAHCYNPKDCSHSELGAQKHCNDAKPFLLDAIQPLAASDSAQPSAITVLVGPEGDFSVEEVRLAISQGYTPVSLGDSRLRTETAALVAVHLMQLAANLNQR